MSLSAIDSLNIIGYYGEMELPTAEKKVRIVMAEQLQETVSKYYETVRAILADEKASKRKKDLLLAAAVVSLKNAYLSLFDKYYPAYINAAGTGSGESYSGAEAWKRRRAYDFALWITQTAQREPNVAFSESHAAAVTRTEVNAVCNLAAMDAAYRQGKRFKAWKTFGDVKVRPSHKAANGQRVPLDMPFTVGGYEMMFPNDSSLGAPAGEVVNCRCVLEFDDGRVLTNSDERGIMRVERKFGKSTSGKAPERSGAMELSSRFVNSNEALFHNAAKIKPLDGYSDIVIHGSPTELLVYGNEGEEWSYGAKEAAEFIRTSREFCGKPIRLIACQTGALKDGIAQQIADELGVNVLAPTEIVNVDIDGEMFISDNKTLSEIWNISSYEERKTIHETGRWVEFTPRKK